MVLSPSSTYRSTLIMFFPAFRHLGALLLPARFVVLAIERVDTRRGKTHRGRSFRTEGASWWNGGPGAGRRVLPPVECSANPPGPSPRRRLRLSRSPPDFPRSRPATGFVSFLSDKKTNDKPPRIPPRRGGTIPRWTTTLPTPLVVPRRTAVGLMARKWTLNDVTI